MYTVYNGYKLCYGFDGLLKSMLRLYIYIYSSIYMQHLLILLWNVWVESRNLYSSINMCSLAGLMESLKGFTYVLFGFVIFNTVVGL